MRWLLLLLPVLAGCEHVQPYMKLSAGKQIASGTDYWVHPDRPWQCDGTKFNGEIGIEHKSGLMLGWHHESFWDCGGPFNERPEITQEDIRLTYKIGGFK